MTRFCRVCMVLGIAAALFMSVDSSFGRGGGRGGGGRGGGGGGGGGGMGGGGMGGRGGNQQPQVNPTIQADQEQVSTYSAALNAATNVYTTALSTFRTNYMKQPDYAAAQKAVDEANRELDAARSAVIAKLKASDPAYKAALQKESDARKKLDQIRANGGSRDQISDQSKLILDAGDVVSKLEAEALAKDTTYQDCKKKLADAVAALEAQKTAMNEAIAADPNLTTLKQTMDTAKTNLSDAQKKLAADRVTYGG
jgi:chromosome segregation ATPase